MDTPIKWNASASRQFTTVARPRWGQVRLGLLLAVVGEVLFLGLGLLGLALLRPLNEPAAALFVVEPEDIDALGWLLVSVGALLGCGLVLVGQFHCLRYAPQSHGAKDSQYACLFCSLLAPACFTAAHFLGGKATYAALRRSFGGLASLDLLGTGILLQFAGALMALLSVLLFTSFARAVVRCVCDEGSRVGGLYFWFVAFLFGGTVGLFLEARRTFRQGLLPLLALAWLLCLVWHTHVLHHASRRIARALRKQKSRVLPTGPVAGQVVLQVASYLTGGKGNGPR
jgi:hypothetical protein